MAFARGVLVVGLGLLAVQLAWADGAVPNCPAYRLRNQNGGNPGSLSINNDQVINWKQSTPNQFTDRGHVTGTIANIYPDHSGHLHFSLSIGPNTGDTVEIIYNQDFGQAPDPRVGMTVEACGDYITSTAPAPSPQGGSYPASPDGALIHWVHIAPGSSGHNSGFLVMDGQVVGNDLSQAGPGPRAHHSDFNNDSASGTDLNAR